MLGIFGLFLQAAAGHILYLALHLESGSFPRPLPPDRERAAFADLQKGGAAAAQARDTLIRHNLRLVAHICKKYYAGNSAQDDMISIGTIGLIKAVDTFDPAKGKRFASYASRCIENELRMDLRRGRRTGVTLSLQEPLEADGRIDMRFALNAQVDGQKLFTALNGFDKRLTLNAAPPVTLTLRDQTLNREDLLMLCVKVMERLLARMELSAA